MTDITEPAESAGVPPEVAQLFRTGLMARLHMEILEVSAAGGRARMPVAGNTQPLGLLHGGASAALAETLGSVAAGCHAGPGRCAVGIELSISHHRSARDGYVYATARAAKLGSTLACYDVVLEDEDDNRLATARLTCMVRSVSASAAAP